MNKLLIIIVTYNSSSVIEGCVASLAKQDSQNFDIFFVDNASQDNSLSILDGFKKDWSKERVNIHKSDKNLGFAKAVNIGLKHAVKQEYEAVLLLNPDTTTAPNLIAEGLRIVCLDNVGACSPVVQYPDGKVWWAGTHVFNRAELLNLSNFSIGQHIDKGKSVKQHKDVFPVEAISGCSMFVDVQAIAKVGFFDERYFMYCEDVDYSLRLKNAGYKPLCFTTSKTIHLVQDRGKKSLKGNARKYTLYLTSVSRFISSHYNNLTRLIWLIRLPVVLVMQNMAKK